MNERNAKRRYNPEEIAMRYFRRWQPSILTVNSWNGKVEVFRHRMINQK